MSRLLAEVECQISLNKKNGCDPPIQAKSNNYNNKKNLQKERYTN